MEHTHPARAKRGHGATLSRRSPRWIALFQIYVRRFLRRHFHAVRLTRDSLSGQLPEGPVIVAMNHPSWWDPMIGMLLSQRWSTRVHLAPIDAAALRRYRFFERLGLFGVEPGSRAGYEQLLAAGDEAFARRDTMFWITPQGTFRDVRDRPMALRNGVGELAHRMRDGTIVPVALEYTFWSEKLPEALVRIGEPIAVRGGRALAPDEWTRRVERAMEHNQDVLAAAARTRDEGAFATVLAGGAGVTWLYDAWRRLAAWVRGESFDPEHAAVLRERARREAS